MGLHTHESLGFLGPFAVCFRILFLISLFKPLKTSELSTPKLTQDTSRDVTTSEFELLTFEKPPCSDTEEKVTLREGCSVNHECARNCAYSDAHNLVQMSHVATPLPLA